MKDVYLKDQILGDYKILEFISSGGMGSVYKACHKDDPETIMALKVIKQEFSSNEGFISRFKHERRQMLKLSDPHIVLGRHFGEDKGRHYLIMDYIEGESLRDRLNREPGKRLPVKDTVAMAAQLSSALAHAHSTGVIHRDIKPENILLRKSDGAALLTDFGLMKAIGEQNYLKSSFAIPESCLGSEAPVPESCLGSEDGAAKSPVGNKKSSTSGTLAYMSPEQVEGQNISAQSDIYQLGVVMYECLTGERPHGKFADPSKHNPEVRKELENVVFKCLESKPASRYNSASELNEELQKQSGASAVSKYPPSGKEHTVGVDKPAAHIKETLPQSKIQPRSRLPVFEPMAGKKIQTPDELFVFCLENPEAAEEYLYSGEIEKWLKSVYEDKFAFIARQIRESCPDRQAGLIEFAEGRRPYITPKGKSIYTLEELKKEFQTNKAMAMDCIARGAVESWLRYIGKMGDEDEICAGVDPEADLRSEYKVLCTTEADKLSRLTAFTQDKARILAAFIGEDQSLIDELSERERQQREQERQRVRIKNISKLIDQCKETYKLKQYKEVIEKCREVLEIDATNAEASDLAEKAENALLQIDLSRAVLQAVLIDRSKGSKTAVQKNMEVLLDLLPESPERSMFEAEHNRITKELYREADENQQRTEKKLKEQQKADAERIAFEVATLESEAQELLKSGDWRADFGKASSMFEKYKNLPSDHPFTVKLIKAIADTITPRIPHGLTASERETYQKLKQFAPKNPFVALIGLTLDALRINDEIGSRIASQHPAGSSPATPERKSHTGWLLLFVAVLVGVVSLFYAVKSRGSKGATNTEVKAKEKTEAEIERNKAFNGPYSRMTWQDGVYYCKRNGGRLPTRAELQDMYEAECNSGHNSDSCGRLFWSSEEYVPDTTLARGRFFLYDENVVDYKTRVTNVRCVRGGS